MRAIINRRIYDTEKSELLARAKRTSPAIIAGIAGMEPDIQEGLYKSPNLGHLFIYRIDSDGFGDPKSTIRLVSQDEALEWLAEHGLLGEEMYRKIGVQLEEA